MRRILLLGALTAVAVGGWMLPSQASAKEVPAMQAAEKAVTQGGHRGYPRYRRGDGRGRGWGRGDGHRGARYYHAPRVYYVQPQRVVRPAPTVVYSAPGYYSGGVCR